MKFDKAAFCPDCGQDECRCNWLLDVEEDKALPSFEIKAIVQGGQSYPLSPSVKVVVDRETLVIL